MSHVIMLSVPGLREPDLERMPRLNGLGRRRAPLDASFPCVTWPVQANMLTGLKARGHGVVANGFYWRDTQEVEMWTAWNDKIQAPQIWDRLHERDPQLTSAVWFPMLSKGCGADYVCMPAPIHNPDGSESLWCYTKPTELYGELRDALGHFPLQHFWGPLASIASTAWIVDSAVLAIQRFRPRFSFLYLPHLDYAAQKHGPDSPQALAALAELDGAVGRLVDGCQAALPEDDVLWLAASEYVIRDVSHVAFPNRRLREAGLLQVREQDGQEHLDLQASRAWALVDHQLAHVYVRDESDAQRAADVLRAADGIAEVLVGSERAKYDLDHERSGELVLVSEPHSWLAYYWWLEDARAPDFARTVDIHRKPGYDPVELFWDPAAKGVPLDAALVKGSHGAPVGAGEPAGVLLASQDDLLPAGRLRDVDLAGIVLRQFS